MKRLQSLLFWPLTPPSPTGIDDFAPRGQPAVFLIVAARARSTA
jgi:hypothetical protein